MERDFTQATLDAIVFLTGAVLSAMLGHLQWRLDRATRKVSGYLLLWVLGFIWTFGNFLRCTLELAQVNADAGSARFAETLAWSCTLLGPITVGLLLKGAIGATSRASRGFFALTVGVSLLNLGLMIRAYLLHGGHLDASSYPTTSFYVALVVGVLALLLYVRGRAGAPARKLMPRWLAPAALLFAAVHTTAILLSTLGGPSRGRYSSPCRWPRPITRTWCSSAVSGCWRASRPPRWWACRSSRRRRVCRCCSPHFPSPR